MEILRLFFLVYVLPRVLLLTSVTALLLVIKNYSHKRANAFTARVRTPRLFTPWSFPDCSIYRCLPPRLAGAAEITVVSYGETTVFLLY
jgi:hypothetical protein